MPLLCNPNFIAINTLGNHTHTHTHTHAHTHTHTCTHAQGWCVPEQIPPMYFPGFWKPDNRSGLVQMLQDDEIPQTGRANSVSVFSSVFNRLCFETVTVLPPTHAPLFALGPISVSVCSSRVFLKPSDFMDNKAERRVIDTRAANCCWDTKPT